MKEMDSLAGHDRKKHSSRSTLEKPAAPRTLLHEPVLPQSRLHDPVLRAEKPRIKMDRIAKITKPIFSESDEKQLEKQLEKKVEKKISKSAPSLKVIPDSKTVEHAAALEREHAQALCEVLNGAVDAFTPYEETIGPVFAQKLATIRADLGALSHEVRRSQGGAGNAPAGYFQKVDMLYGKLLFLAQDKSVREVESKKSGLRNFLFGGLKPPFLRSHERVHNRASDVALTALQSITATVTNRWIQTIVKEAEWLAPLEKMAVQLKTWREHMKAREGKRGSAYKVLDQFVSDAERLSQMKKQLKLQVGVGELPSDPMGPSVSYDQGIAGMMVSLERRLVLSGYALAETQLLSHFDDGKDAIDEELVWKAGKIVGSHKVEEKHPEEVRQVAAE